MSDPLARAYIFAAAFIPLAMILFAWSPA